MIAVARRCGQRQHEVPAAAASSPHSNHAVSSARLSLLRPPPKWVMATAPGGIAHAVEHPPRPERHERHRRRRPVCIGCQGESGVVSEGRCRDPASEDDSASPRPIYPCRSSGNGDDAFHYVQLANASSDARARRESQAWACHDDRHEKVAGSETSSASSAGGPPVEVPPGNSFTCAARASGSRVLAL